MYLHFSVDFCQFPHFSPLCSTACTSESFVHNCIIDIPTTIVFGQMQLGEEPVM